MLESWVQKELPKTSRNSLLTRLVWCGLGVHGAPSRWGLSSGAPGDVGRIEPALQMIPPGGLDHVPSTQPPPPEVSSAPQGWPGPRPRARLPTADTLARAPAARARALATKTFRLRAPAAPRGAPNPGHPPRAYLGFRGHPLDQARPGSRVSPAERWVTRVDSRGSSGGFAGLSLTRSA